MNQIDFRKLQGKLDNLGVYIKTGETFVITPYSKYDVQEFEKENNINLNDLLN